MQRVSSGKKKKYSEKAKTRTPKSSKTPPKQAPVRHKTSDSKPSKRRSSSQEASSHNKQQIKQSKEISKTRTQNPAKKKKKKTQINERERKKNVPAKTSKKIVLSLIGNIIFYVTTLSIIAMAIMFSFSSKSSASIFGYRFYTVLTNSMVPQENGPKGGFYAGDIVVVQLMDGTKVKVNDIVTFSVGDGTRYLTHRVVEEKDELNGETGKFIVTKGDANKTNDPPIKADRVVGKVVTVLPKIGYVLDFIREQFWACLICVVSFYGFFLVLKAYLFTPKTMNSKTRRKQKNIVHQGR